MSRIDHIIARRTESARKPRRLEKITQSDGYRFVTLTTTSPQHKQGNQWWRSRFAELHELRVNDRVRDPKPPRKPAPALAPTDIPRPEGMSRQVYRALCRAARKTATRV